MAREAAQLAAGSIIVFIETDKFKPEPQYANAVAMTVALKSDSTIKLRDLALSGLAKVLRSGFGYRRAGATLGGLELVERVSMRLWENEGYERHRRRRFEACCGSIVGKKSQAGRILHSISRLALMFE
jgi:hypothetical protein